ncbi:flagellar hook protein FliD [Parashewanella spongiae]|uniref:Flagellar hook-associated protein 2 n=1 Tax=Parashewanella spongiae TaxID=342950 RepID=A0A3A6UD16_9GAMM|nr:flagellar filament capping protein FliD [Parashewanella spongiae]MCL1076623.1 flagellar filament capping protein FliD [Parashewanella spongiae]RJY19577.1 flagellar hook protein FliD [Parashewanella spongiae]
MISNQGLGSGLDISGIVTALVGAERGPKDAQLNAEQGRLTTEISAIGSLKSAMKTFEDSMESLGKSSTFLGNKTTLSNSDYLSATSEDDAVAGSYNVEVVELARSQKLGSQGFNDVTTPVGEGSLNFAIGGEDFDVAVAADASLQDIMRAINSSDDNIGITATIVNNVSTDPTDPNAPTVSRLVLTSDDTGVVNDITVDATDVSGTALTDAFENMEVLQASRNATLNIDGLSISSASNEVENAIQGVTLNLKDADVDESTTITIAPNTGAAKTQIESFVEAYNELMTTIDNLSGYDADTQRAGALQGDSLVRSVESQLRNTLSSGFGTEDGEMRLSEFGISSDRYGMLEIDSDRLDDALENNLNGMSEFFTAEDTGFAATLTNRVEVYSETGGLLDSRDESLDRQVDRIGDSREALDRKMVSLQARLTQQYNAMDLLVGSLSQQSADLTNRLNSLPGLVPQS